MQKGSLRLKKYDRRIISTVCFLQLKNHIREALMVWQVFSKNLGPSWERAVIVSENAPVAMRLQWNLVVACVIHEFIHKDLLEKDVKILECLLEVLWRFIL